MAFDYSQQLTDSSVFDLIDNTGGPVIPSPDELNFEENTSKEKGSKAPPPGVGANNQILVQDASQLFKETPGLEELFNSVEEQGVIVDQEDPINTDPNLGPDTGGEYDPSPDNDFWTGVDFYAAREDARAFYDTNFSNSPNGDGIGTFHQKFGSNPGSDGLQDYFNDKFSDSEYTLQFLGGISGGWNLETEPTPGYNFDPASAWRKYLEWKHVWRLGGHPNPANDMTQDEYNETGGPRAIYEANPDIYGTDESQWSFISGGMNTASSAGFNLLYATGGPSFDVVAPPNGVWDEGEDWDDQSLPGQDTWGNNQYDEGEEFTDTEQLVGALGSSIHTYLQEVERRENTLSDQFNNPHAPSYWEGIYSIPWQDTVTTANEMADAWQDENWLEVYGPFISGLGITIEQFMDEYGGYLEPYNPDIPQEIQQTIGSFKNEARQRVQGDLDEERMSMVKSGFTESYQNTEALNNLINDFDATINTLDSDAAEDINNYNESWYSDFIQTMTEIGELGGFDSSTWEELLDTSVEDDEVLQQEVMQELEESANNTGFAQHYA
tara:strand:+ start:1510 stop:3165 length:1656 start_codon:yes stop_codon:yes gene_type:complete